MIKSVDYRIVVGIILTGMNNTADKEAMKDLNAMPVNVRAREFLEESGGEVSHDSIFCAQAALYALKHGLVEAEEDVAQTLNAMISWRPQRIANFLILMHVDEYDPPGWKDASGIKDFAEAIIDDIEQKMIRHFPYYRSSES